MIKKLINDEEENKDVNITINNYNNIFIIHIDDYISSSEYVSKMEKLDIYKLSNMISHNILWNSSKQKINKGKLYIFSSSNKLYNVLINDVNLVIDERTRNGDITDEKIIKFNTESNIYKYTSLKHDKIGSTFYTKFYSKDRTHLTPSFYLSKEEAFDEINNIIHHLQDIKEIKHIFDINLLKIYILNDFDDIKNRKL